MGAGQLSPPPVHETIGANEEISELRLKKTCRERVGRCE
jgi:hypothetical protein